MIVTYSTRLEGSVERESHRGGSRICPWCEPLERLIVWYESIQMNDELHPVALHAAERKSIYISKDEGNKKAVAYKKRARTLSSCSSRGKENRGAHLIEDI